MYVETILSTKIDNVAYELRVWDEGRKGEHYEVQIRDESEVSEERPTFGGVILASLRSDSFDQARQAHDALVTVATLPRRDRP
jgi:anti-sigma regulatory factor (Ser/Thr protein kinase)